MVWLLWSLVLLLGLWWLSVSLVEPIYVAAGGPLVARYAGRAGDQKHAVGLVCEFQING